MNARNLVDPSAQHRLALKAAWIVPVDQPPIRDGLIMINKGRIEAVEPASASSQSKTIDLGEVAILPGLINAHSHLEFSDLAEPLGHPGIAFTDWIQAVIAHRQSSDPSQPKGDKSKAIKKGLAECVREGIAAIGEIATLPYPYEPFEKSPLASTLFLELMGSNPQKIGAQIEQARQHLALLQKNDPTCRAGLSPHAPYTASIDLVQQGVVLSKEKKVPIAMHLAESREEMELLASHAGPMVELLQSRDAWNPNAFPRGITTLDYLQMLARSPTSLIIHGNYLDAASHTFLATHSDQMAVVYCPRTHAYFQHASYPLEAMLVAGVKIALGTDSRASNPDLSLLAEMRHAARAHPHISPEKILLMGTLHGASALGIAHEKGSLTPGKQANLTLLRLPHPLETDPIESLLFEDSPIEALYLSGKRID